MVTKEVDVHVYMYGKTEAWHYLRLFLEELPDWHGHDADLLATSLELLGCFDGILQFRSCTNKILENQS